MEPESNDLLTRLRNAKIVDKGLGPGFVEVHLPKMLYEEVVAALAAHEEGGGMRICNRPGCGNGPLDDVCEVCRTKDALASQEPSAEDKWPGAPHDYIHDVEPTGRVVHHAPNCRYCATLCSTTWPELEGERGR